MMDEYYEELHSTRNEEKALRVKVNQLENDIDHNIKRLDIICKTKGLPRPQRRNSAGGSAYVSPYRR